jgi:uncharacterized protein
MVVNINDELVNKARDYVANLLKNDTTGHDLYHSLRVYKLAMHIASKEDIKNLDFKVITLASLLHDVDDYKIFNNDDNDCHNALKFLKENNVDSNSIEKITYIINNMSFHHGVVELPIEGKIVQDADRLEAIGAIGIARTFTYGGSKNRLIYDGDITQECTIKHFYDKLLKLKDMMNTKEGKRIAIKRHQFLIDYLDEFYKEWDVKIEDEI